MHTQHKTNPERMQDAKASFQDAWLTTSIDINNAKAVIDLVWQSMSDNDWRSFVPEQLVATCDFADMQRRALDAAIPILATVSKFFQTYECGAWEGVYGSGEAARHCSQTDQLVNDELASMIDEYRFAFDTYDELCPTMDRQDERYDPSRAARERFRKAERHYIACEQALAEYRPLSLAELRLKIATICDLRRRNIFADDLMDDVLASLLDFGQTGTHQDLNMDATIPSGASADG